MKRKTEVTAILRIEITDIFDVNGDADEVQNGINAKLKELINDIRNLKDVSHLEIKSSKIFMNEKK